MTIGPEPRMRILWRSSRLGMALGGRPDLVDEAVEEVQRVVRPGPGLRVVLDRPARHVEQREPLDRPVVEVDVAEARRAEVGLPDPRLRGGGGAGARRAAPR